jgi:hypothetical protein
MQKLRSILFAVIIMVGSCFSTVYAAPGASPSSLSRHDVMIVPFYVYAHMVETDLSISGTTATAYVSLDGNSGAKSVNVTYSLQEKSGSNWNTVITWTASSSTRFLNSQNSYSSLIAGEQYRVYATFTVTGINGGIETITDYSGTYTC